MIAYTLFTNLDSRYLRCYEPGDRLVRGWQGTIDAAPTDGGHGVAERLFARHNRDDRPDGQLCPSMSVGDVVVLGETAYSVGGIGFATVDLDPADLITDRSWLEVVR